LNWLGKTSPNQKLHLTAAASREFRDQRHRPPQQVNLVVRPFIAAAMGRTTKLSDQGIRNG